MTSYDSVLERTAVVIVVDDSKLQSELKRATDQVKRAAKDQASAQKTVASGAGDAEKGFAELRAEITRLREQTVRIKRDADAYLDTQKRQATAARADAAAQKELDGRIKELGLQVRNVRSAFINGRIASDEFARSSEGLKGEINELLDSTTLTTAQQLKLNIASATAQRGLSSVRGEASRLGLAWNVQIGIANQFGQQLRGLGPVGQAAAAGLGLVQNGFASLQRPVDLSGVSLERFLSTAARAPQILALAGAAATAFAVVGLTRLAKDAARTADEIDKASQSAGLATEAFQEITFALSQNGVSLEQARQGLNDFNARLGQAAQGSTGVAKAYAELGVSVRDASGEVRDSDAVFTDLITALSGVESTALQAAIGGQVFGEEFSRRIIPTLKNGADGFAALREQARAMGLVISGDAILSLVAFKDEMAVLERQFSTAKVEIAAAFLPILRDVLMPLLQNTVVPWIQEASSSVADLAAKFTEAGPDGDAFRRNLVDMIAPLIAVGQTALGVGAAVYGSFQAMIAGAVQLGTFLGTLSAEAENDPRGTFQSFARGVMSTVLPGVYAPLDPADNPFARASQAAQLASQGPYDAANRTFDLVGSAFGFDPQTFFTGMAEAARTAFATPAGAFAGLGAGSGGGGAGGGAGSGAVPFSTRYTSEQLVEIFKRQLALTDRDVAARLNAQQGGIIAEGLPQTAAAVREAFLDRIGAALISDRGATRGSGLMAAGDPFSPLGSGSMFPTGQAAQLILRDVQARQQAEGALIASVREAGSTRRQAYAIEVQATAAAAAEVAAAEAAANDALIASVREAGNLRRCAYTIEAQREADAARAARAALLERIGAAAISDRGRTRGDPSFGNTAGGLFTPPTAPPEIQALIDAGAKVRLELAQGAERTRLEAVQTRQEIALAGLDFASNIAAAIRSGSPSGIFGAATGGIGSLIGIFNPLAGQIFSTIGGIFSGLLPNSGGLTSDDAQRAAGNAARGAPAVSIHVEQNNSLSVLGLPQVGDAMSEALDRLTRVVEQNVVPRLGRLEARTGVT